MVQDRSSYSTSILANPSRKEHFGPALLKYLRRFLSSFEITNFLVHLPGHFQVLLPIDMLRVSLELNCHETKNLKDKVEAPITLLLVDPRPLKVDWDPVERPPPPNTAGVIQELVRQTSKERKKI